MSTLENAGMGCIAFSPLAQGLLSDKYLHGIPMDSRAGKPHGFLRPKDVTDVKIAKVQKLDRLAKERGQTLAQMALAWVLRLPGMTSALIGASRIQQVEVCVSALNRLDFSSDELNNIESVLSG